MGCPQRVTARTTVTRSSPLKPLSRRLRAQWHEARGQWAGLTRWVLARRFILPAVLGWAMFSEAGGRPWRAAEALVVMLALLARFTWPSAALLVTVSMLYGPPVGALAVPVLAYRAGRRIPARRRVTVVFGAAAVLVTLNVFALALSAHVHDVGDLRVVFAAAAACVGLGLFLPGAIGLMGAERGRRVDALRERNAILERADRLVDEQARAQERARIAGEMHDLLGHRLSLISLHAGALELGARQGAPALSEQASAVRTMTRVALDELREVINVLRLDTPPGDSGVPDDDLGTRSDVSALVLASQRAGQQVQMEWIGDDLAGMDPSIRRAVHRVTREALTNVHKHAPGAATTVRISRKEDGTRIEVRNELPVPMTPGTAGTGTGLAGLRERVRLAGGTIAAGVTSDRSGFEVAAFFPHAPVPEQPRRPGGDAKETE
jgi:signal transduction histidine kinase